ncbi:MAG: transcription factor, partial [Geobacteraceae bacterium]|nr:transcription factor [Geobacteraceae bacterium]
AAVPVTILSIIPVQAEPGAKVMLSGTGFGESASVVLGSVEITARITGGKQAEFNLPPQLEAGLYALYLKRSDGTTGRSYNFTVLPLRPVLNSLQPPQISSCAAGKEREVIARGGNFGGTSMLFFDGAALTSTLLSTESISFIVPAVSGGLHQVQVKNAPENSSVQLNLAVETRPEIGQVTVGDEHVNYYELVISGRNFNQNSSVYVDGMQIGGRGGQDMVEREKLIYVDCAKLIYQRHPYSPVTKDFRLQVVNPGGEGSQVITVTAP